MKKKKVLFFCKHNACRSQMAEALLRHLASERFEVHSAGLHPQPIHPLVDAVMKELGIDTSRQTSKSIDLYFQQQRRTGSDTFDYIIIVCKESEADCPALYPFALNVLRWPLNDPALVPAKDPQEAIKAFRAVRDELEIKLTEWLKNLN
jgi:arsenate reductase